MKLRKPLFPAIPLALAFVLLTGMWANLTVSAWANATVPFVDPSNYAVQAGGSLGIAPVEGPWLYQFGQFAPVPDCPTITDATTRYTDAMFYSAGATRYSFTFVSGNATTVGDRRMTFRFSTTHKDIGLSLGYKASTAGTYDYAWALNVQANAPAGTLYYRAVKISADGTATPLWTENWRNKVYQSAVTVADILPVAVFRADLAADEVMAVQSYYVFAEPDPETVAYAYVSLGIPAVTPVQTIVGDPSYNLPLPDEASMIYSHLTSGSKTNRYRVRTYFPTIRMGGTVFKALEFINDRVMFEPIYFYGSSTSSTIDWVTPDVEKFTSFESSNTIKAYFSKDTSKGMSVFINSPAAPTEASPANSFTQFTPIAPFDMEVSGAIKKVMTGLQIRFAADESGYMTFWPKSSGGYSNGYARVIHRADTDTFLTNGTANGWVSGSNVKNTNKFACQVEKGDEIVLQMVFNSSTNFNFVNFYYTIEQPALSALSSTAGALVPTLAPETTGFNPLYSDYTLIVPNDTTGVALEYATGNSTFKVAGSTSGTLTFDDLQIGDNKKQITLSWDGKAATGVYNVNVIRQDTPAGNLFGDVNGDGAVDGTDVECLRKHLLKKEPLTGEQLVAADVSGESGIDILDLLTLKQIAGNS
ncbi:MAG: dockerin type I repeat-containing protein [Oscillospiraceae bacterium]|nr:dockerin type I repeat-containing protein [Oscillospiraceae bacterium]